MVRPSAAQISPLEHFLAERSAMREAKTFTWYKSSLGDFDAFCRRKLNLNGRSVEPKMITKPLVLAWVADMRGRIGEVSVNTYYRGLSAYLNWLADEKFIKVSPLARMKPPKVPRRSPGEFTNEDIEKMMMHCPVGVWWGARDGAIVQTLLRTGMRVGELVGMEEANIDWQGRKVKVVGKGNKERSLWLDGATVQWLLRYRRRRSDYPHWWQGQHGEKLTDNAVKQMIRKLARRARVSGKRASPHTFRHTFALTYLRGGGDIRTLQELLGHATLRATEVYLRQITQEDALRKHALLDPMKHWRS